AAAAGASGGGAAAAAAAPWPGTLFRFPLRSAELAAASTISKQVYTPESVRVLLQQLCSESSQILLFLKHIVRLEVYEWPRGAAQPHLLFACHVSNPSQEVLWERGLFARVSGERPSSSSSSAPSLAAAAAAGVLAATGSATSAAAADSGYQPLPDILRSYRLELQSEWYDTGGTWNVRQEEGEAEQQQQLQGQRRRARRRLQRRSFIVSQMRGGGDVAEFADQLSRHFGVPLVAWGAVAADITVLTSAAAAARAGSGAGGEEDQEQEEEEVAAAPEEGRAFCFLPLPARTGLPVHVNGYFELSSNRRDIWHGEDMAGSGARRAQWNTM
ncbi:hypothetical protein Agub_g226, partial [Astrephomene gubernaculifera]